MQNRTDSGIPRFSTPHTNMTFPLHNITIKVTKWMKYEIKVYNFFRFLVCSQYFKFSLSDMLTSEIEVINRRNQNMAVLLNVIAIH